VKAVTVYNPCKCCRMITIDGRGKYRIMLPCISSNCTLRNCLSLQNGLISHEAPLCWSVPRCQEDWCRWGSSHSGFQSETIHWLLHQVGHAATNSALCYGLYAVIEHGPCKTYRIRKHRVLCHSKTDTSSCTWRTSVRWIWRSDEGVRSSYFHLRC
jgi:hypothetical protein